MDISERLTAVVPDTTIKAPAGIFEVATRWINLMDKGNIGIFRFWIIVLVGIIYTVDNSAISGLKIVAVGLSGARKGDAGSGPSEFRIGWVTSDSVAMD